MAFGNIFDDPEVKRQILEDQGIKPSEDDSYELIESDGEDLSNFQEIIDSAPKIPGGGVIKNIIKDASAIVKENNQAKELAINNAISDIFSQYNKEYGLDLQIDPGNFTKTLLACSDERKQKILTLYMSRCVRSIRPILILNLITKLSMALDVILSPDKLLNPNELSLPDLFLAASQILDYIGKLEELKDSILVDNEGLELKKIAEESNVEYEEQDEEMIKNFMDLFKTEKLKQ